jgi:Sulfotransferase family
MIYSRARNFIFVHNPKAAGTAFRASIEKYHDHKQRFWGISRSQFFARPLDMAHLRMWELHADFPDITAEMPRLTTLMFVRDPMKRFVSSCFEYFARYRKRANFDRLNTTQQAAAILRLGRTELSPMSVIWDYRYIHFSPQSWFACLGGSRMVEHLVAVESGFDALVQARKILDLPPVPGRQRNRRTPEQWTDLLNAEIADFVQEFYARDYELFADARKAAGGLEVQSSRR